MGMSASQARLLSLTARMHDLEYQAQTIQNAKLSLADNTSNAYAEYNDEINASKFQISVMSAGAAATKVDLTFNNLIASGSELFSPKYILTDAETDEIYLPEQITKELNGRIPGSLDEFLQIVANKYVFTGQNLSISDAVSKLSENGAATYWTGVYYQLAGYTDNEGNSYKAHGFKSVSTQDAADRDWIKKQVKEARVILNKMQTTQVEVGTTSVNNFFEVNMANDQDLSEADDEKRIKKAEREYEDKMENIHMKDKQLDLRLARIENERNAIKTEYDTVKDLVKKNIERSYKTFNA